jgi:hypothetical protein
MKKVELYIDLIGLILKSKNVVRTAETNSKGSSQAIQTDPAHSHARRFGAKIPGHARLKFALIATYVPAKFLSAHPGKNALAWRSNTRLEHQKKKRNTELRFSGFNAPVASTCAGLRT